MPYDNYFLEWYANDTLAEARDFAAREQLAQPDQRGRVLRWVMAGLAVIGMGLIARRL